MKRRRSRSRTATTRTTTDTRRPRGSRPRRRVRVAIGLGANLGNPLRTLRRAVETLRSFLSNVRISPLYRTSPVGGPRQPDYLNAVLVAQTSLPPGDLLARLAAIEEREGRARTRVRNAPRTLDLDLLLYGNHVIQSPDLHVPHPRLSQRRFVLAPLADLLPRRVVPGTSRTVRRILADAPPGRMERLAVVI